ncbi:UPF0587 protein C1orf123 homolog isoform X1 [Tetranychus urticae]|uniref:UPF0587 protein C1orf123 homolog isoform X1 n=1 Tax=Tetranychus urticae TaxID=32264 RepID=UPI00077BD5A5|nr:UPF0587 protein C1orf123 homolog isoform X1 [Tetranychus urticae]
MVKIALKVKANLENVTNLKPANDDFEWIIKVKCNSCNEASDKWHQLTVKETYELKGSRGEAHFVYKCKLCSITSSISILPETIGSYNADDSLKFKKLIVFDCRGIEPIDYQPRDGFVCEGLESGKVFSAVEFQDGEWADYDEKANESVGIYEFESKFERD